MSAVKGAMSRGCGPAPMTIIFRAAGSASTSDEKLPSRAVEARPGWPFAFMLALKSTTTTVSPAGAPK